MVTPNEQRQTLAGYVMENATRGACTCGQCVDGVADPEKHQPPGEHVIDLTFFKVGFNEAEANPETFKALVAAEFPQWLDGQEHNYLNVGGDMGDQGLALMTIGLGHLLRVWKALCPETMLPFLDEGTKRLMAGNGMIALQVPS